MKENKEVIEMLNKTLTDITQQREQARFSRMDLNEKLEKAKEQSSFLEGATQMCLQLNGQCTEILKQKEKEDKNGQETN